MVSPCEDCSLNTPPVRSRGCASQPDIMFVGEAPGAEEVARGEPFAGKAGRLLRETLQALGFNLSRVYYTNAVLCRPPGNRDPRAGEVRACHGRLMQEIAEVQPRVIVAMGNHSTTSLLGSGKGITRRRGQCRKVGDIWVVPTLHPAGVLRVPGTYIDFVDDLALAQTILQGEDPIIDPPYHNYRIVDTNLAFGTLMGTILEAGRVAVDIETTSLDYRTGHILSIGLSSRRGSANVVDWQAVLEHDPQNRRILGEVLQSVDCYFHNGKFDVKWLHRHGVRPRFTRDTMLMSYMLDERQGVHSLKSLATRRYGAPAYGEGIIPEGGLRLEDWHGDLRETVLKYNGADADYTWRLSQDLWHEMVKQDLAEPFTRIVMPSSQHFTEFEETGMLVDVEYLEKIGDQWREETAAIEAEIRQWPGAAGINLRSTKQVADYLFGTLGLKPMRGPEGEIIDQTTLREEIEGIDDPEAVDYWRGAGAVSGKLKPRSTSTYMLHYLAQQHDFPRLLIKHRDISKRYSMYYEAIKKLVGPDGRVYPDYKLHGTRTGRLSTKAPNIHSIPRKKEIKKIFIADPGWTIIYGDYSQAEIRMLAHFAQDENLIRALGERDIHTSIMKELFHISDEDIGKMPEEERGFKRRAAKTVAFGIIYGKSARSLAPQLGVSVEEATLYKNRLLQIMPGVARWINDQHRLVGREQEVLSLYGRRRRFPLIPQGGLSEVQRQAVNTPIQSSVSDMNLLAHIRVVEELRKAGIPAKIWPSIHDAFMVLVPDIHVPEATEIFIREMRAVDFNTDVPFAAEIAVGKSWGDLETVYEG